MEALDALLTRVSHARLSDPAPSPEQLDRLFRVALRAPDHGQLRPWRFILVEGEGRRALGDLYARALASRQPDAAEEALAKARNMPLRAPLLVVAVACLQDHPKVPHGEQLLAAGCAAHGLVLGAYAQGLGAMWRTGEMATDPVVHAGLGLGEQERIIGFVYLGTPMGELRTPTELDLTAFVSAWPG
ncbi:nitroreductase family protein [Pseudomonas aeruginosa]